MTAERWVTPLDRRLLDRLSTEPNLVRAARELGIGRDRAVYRLVRLRRLYGGPVARSRKGGTTAGRTELTPLGRQLLYRSFGSPARTNRWRGTYQRLPGPRVVFTEGTELEVAFRHRDGQAVTVEVDPEAIVVGRRRAELSTRNVLPATVIAVRGSRGGTAELTAHWGDRPVRVALTAGSVDRLGLRPGRRAYLFLKAVAVRRSPTPGSPRR
ncbi:MAG: TOBE domain-containing protein [Thermoplasmata archaeon]|nr:TOBE domain-containing protein [Thermoplasmata archaeon]